MKNNGYISVVDKVYIERMYLDIAKCEEIRIATGFVDLDYQWGGLQRRNVYLLGARPAMGKTAFALSCVQRMAVNNNTKVAYLSCDLSTDQIVNKLLVMESGINERHLRTGKLTDEEWESLILAGNKVGNGQLVISDVNVSNLYDFEEMFRNPAFEGVKVVFIDYFQLLIGSLKAKDNKEAIYGICCKLKELAEMYNVAIVVLSNVSRSAENREDKRPTMEDIEEGDIGSLFDHVAFIYRDDYYNPESEEKGIAEIITGRSKFCHRGTVRLKWNPEKRFFSDL